MEKEEARAGRSSRTRIRQVARLRRWLLGGVVVLVLVLAALLGYARYRAHRFLTDLPHRLGIDIKSETNGFTLSQSSKGHTLFTVHAAKAIQRENGKTTLHDVAITLYGSPGSNRTDSIRGDEFEYDQPNGVVRAAGEVHLDLAAPTQDGAAPKAGAKRIAVITRGLVFLQKLGVAATDEPIEIQYGDMHGGATGADYESDTGLLRLRRDVHLEGEDAGQAMHLDAAAAELNRLSDIATLHTAHIRSGGNSASGNLMTFVLAKGGGLRSVDATGNVTLQRADGISAAAPQLHAEIGGDGKLQQAAMRGGVSFRDNTGSGTAGEALVHFSAAGQAESVDLRHAVRLVTAQPGTAHSELAAEQVMSRLVANGKRSELQDAVASGGAELRTTETILASTAIPTATAGVPKALAKRPTTRTTVVKADTLRAHTAVAGGVRYVAAVDGAGTTRIDEVDDLGNKRSSSGDAMSATLLPPAARGSGAAKNAGGPLQSIVQTGHVVITQHTSAANSSAKASSNQAQDSRATADRAEFDQATQRLVLTGHPQVSTSELQLAANRITMAQGPGGAEAEGDVKATLEQQASSGKGDPVHVVAERASMDGSGGKARFFAGSKPVRMWSATAQLQAAAIDLDRAKGTLAAYAASGQGNVELVLAAPTAAGQQRSRSGSGPVQVTGHELVMTGASGAEPSRVDVSGAVRVVSAGSDLKADHVVATLKPSKKTEASSDQHAKPAADAFSGGSIESILATGHVGLQQPGRTGSGERLLYTEADGRYQLTGTPSAPPTIVDSLRGTVTGATLIFHGADDSVEVAGEPGRRVRTETEAARPLRRR